MSIKRLTEVQILRAQIKEAEELLKPFARVADSGDHFDHDDVKPICSWRIAGEWIVGPSIGDCRAARQFVYARLPLAALDREPREA